jgi:hypothetical protein
MASVKQWKGDAVHLSPFDGRQEWHSGSKLSTGAHARRLSGMQSARRWITCGADSIGALSSQFATAPVPVIA